MADDKETMATLWTGEDRDLERQSQETVRGRDYYSEESYLSTLWGVMKNIEGSVGHYITKDGRIMRDVLHGRWIGEPKEVPTNERRDGTKTIKMVLHGKIKTVTINSLLEKAYGI